MSCLAIITARSGSKRIPHKNIKEFMGKPMLAYAIEVSKKSTIFDEVMVSTDSTEIANIAKKYGATVPFLRSAQAANDSASTEVVLKEVILRYAKMGKNFDTVCCLYPCVPLLTSQTLMRAYQQFLSTDCEALLPVVKFSFPIQRALCKKPNGFLQYREPENAEKRSQDLEPMYHDVGMFYFVQTNAFLEQNTLICQKTALFEMPETHIQDIDNMEDWKMAEMKYRILYGL